MQDIRLYINDQLVDLPEGIDRQLRLSKGGTDAADLEARTADQSYTMTLPFTRTNDALFRNADIQSTGKFFSPSPYRARLEAGGRPLLSGGWRLSGIKGGYQGLIYAEEVDVFAQIAEKTLRDISTMTPVFFRGGHDFADLLEKDNTESDICFPLVAYGNFFAPAPSENRDEPPSNRIKAPLELDDYTPSVYYVNIIRHIFESAGWKAGGEPLEDPFFRQLCLPFTGEEYPWNWGELLKLTAWPGSHERTWSSYNAEEDVDAGRFHRFYPLDLETSYNPAGRYRKDAYVVRREGVYSVALQLQAGAFSWSYSGAWNGVWVELRRVPAGAPYLEGEVVASQQIGPSGSYTGGGVALEETAVWLGETDKLVPVLHVEFYDNAEGTASFSYELEAFSVTPVDEEIGPLTIDITRTLPEMNQRDFVKGFMTLGNLRFVLDARNRSITFYYHDRYELPADFAVDLTACADPAESEFVPATKARRFIFRYAEDSGDALSEQARALADKTVDTRNGNGEGDQVISLPFAATAMRDFWGGGTLHQLPCMASQEQLDAPLNTVSWDYGYAPRLIRYNGPSANALPLAFLPAGSGYYGSGNFAGLNWSELYERHYRGYVTDIVKGHLLKNRFALTPDLYRQLSPSKFVLFHGILYRLNKVQGYAVADEGALTEVELLRMVKEAVSGGRPRNNEAQLTKEWYGEEFYSGEWY